MKGAVRLGGPPFLFAVHTVVVDSSTSDRQHAVKDEPGEQRMPRSLPRLIAPIVLGSGPVGLNLPPIARVDEALRPPSRLHRLGDEVLFDCDLSAQRAAIGRANRSM
jgi:hypothetical protein